MKKIKIGIPRALLYHRYGILWKHFFELLGCNVVLSPETNQKILELGINNTIDETCLSYKIYVGHVLYLEEICDYILISRVCDYGKKDKVCTRLNGTYDDIKNKIPVYKILDFDIEYTFRKYPLLGFIKIGFKFTKNIFKIIYSYYKAVKKQIKYDSHLSNIEKNKLTKENKKILIISRSYNINDKFISTYIKEYLKENNIIPIYSSNIERKTTKEFSEYFSNTLYWLYSKENVGSLYYLKNQINGIIFLSTYPCGIDTLVNNLLILKNKDIPMLNIIIDENINELNLETKLESFLDIMNKGENNE